MIHENQKMTPQAITKLIRNRRSIFPKTYVDKPIPKAIIEEILENANWAPTHKMTEPWRFKVLVDDALIRLRNWQVDWYQNNVPKEKFSEKKFKKLQTKPLQAGCVIAICMQRDAKESIPEWEEIAATAMAVQNMWLTCTANDIGCYCHVLYSAFLVFLGFWIWSIAHFLWSHNVFQIRLQEVVWEI